MPRIHQVDAASASPGEMIVQDEQWLPSYDALRGETDGGRSERLIL